MDASILIVGGAEFLATLLDYAEDFAGYSIEIAASAIEAVPLIQAQQPDLLLIERNQADSLTLCCQTKEQTKLAWIYCVVLDAALSSPPDAWLDQRWELAAHTEALAAGADAYLWLPKTDAKGKPLPPEVLQGHQHLLQAQIQCGLRMVKTYRELMRTNDILSAIALSDPLTELNNRRALDWELPRQVQNARTRCEPLSVLMMDVDFFKGINDTYGHGVGDRALQLISSRLRHNLRFRDTLFRYGGEEFVIILNGTDLDEASVVGRRLCRQISDHPFSIDEHLDLHLTISAGTASLSVGDDPKGTSLLKRADQNLLRAKSTGRNRVVSDLPS
jgi:two-component system cell cycle response regulator